MFTLGIDNYEMGVVGNTAIVMGVVEKFCMKSPLLMILGWHHCLHLVSLKNDLKIILGSKSESLKNIKAQQKIRYSYYTSV